MITKMNTESGIGNDQGLDQGSYYSAFIYLLTSCGGAKAESRYTRVLDHTVKIRRLND